MSEEVLVIPRDLFDRLGSFQGFQTDVDAYLAAMLAPGANHFMERAAAELDPSFKQIIPYSLFRHQDRYLCYTRGSASGEKRLVARHSIGIGGHINPHDESEDELAESMYYNSIARELEEELVIEGDYQQRVIGLINDDSNEVGRVHLGVVHLFDLTSDRISSNEDAIQNPRLLTLAELQAIATDLESWSMICLTHLLKSN